VKPDCDGVLNRLGPVVQRQKRKKSTTASGKKEIRTNTSRNVDTLYQEGVIPGMRNPSRRYQVVLESPKREMTKKKNPILNAGGGEKQRQVELSGKGPKNREQDF